MKLSIALAGLLIIGITPTVVSDNSLEGDRILDCSIYAIQYFDCTPDRCCRGGNDFNVTVGQMESVTLTITWVPESEHATRFKAGILGNFDCFYEASDRSCDAAFADGVSPLVMTLYGTGASNDTIFAGVSLDDNCDQLFRPSESIEDEISGILESCQEGKFFQAAFNQLYHYQWTLTPS